MKFSCNLPVPDVRKTSDPLLSVHAADPATGLPLVPDQGLTGVLAIMKCICMYKLYVQI